MSRVLIVAHQQRIEAAALSRSAAEWLVERGHTVWLTPADAHALGADDLADDADPASAELVLSLGGDGTMLRAVQLLDGARAPILGVNVGLLGYLAELEPKALLPALDRYLTAGSQGRDWRVEERMMIDVEVRRARRPAATDAGSWPAGVERWQVLNEGVVEKLEAGHTVRLAVEIDGAPFTSYAADGLIVATPTGSTAYALSARGPVVSPRHRALLLTPVSPHMLFDRTLVLDPEEDVQIEVLGHRPVVLSVDGQRAAQLVEGDRVVFAASARTARFVRFGPRRFHQILKSKFGLADR
jgi:NAD+ kinase